MKIEGLTVNESSYLKAETKGAFMYLKKELTAREKFRPASRIENNVKFALSSLHEKYMELSDVYKLDTCLISIMSFSTYNREGMCEYKKRRCFVIKKKNSPNRRMERGAINQRISASKATWNKRGKHAIGTHEDRGNLENRLRKIEEHAMETKEHREKLENILVELGEVRQHLAKRNSEQPRRQRAPRLGRKRRTKGEAGIQTTPAEELKTGTGTGRKGGFLQGFLGNVDFAQITSLLQNPMLQSMLQSMLNKTG
jgi:hypothetical protein